MNLFGRATVPGVGYLPAAGTRRSGRLRLRGAVAAGGAVLALAVLAALTLRSAPAQAAFPGQNGRIACQGERGPVPEPGAVPALGQPPFSTLEIYSMNSDGGDQTLLTNNLAADRNPALSPDGNRVAFDSDRHSTPVDLYTMNADGSGVRRLTATRRGEQFEPSWSPDGGSLVFSDGSAGTTPSSGGGINFNISRINADGTGARFLTTDPSDDHGPNWSPDGSRVVFHSARFGTRENVGGAGINWELLTLDAQRGEGGIGGSDIRLTDNLPSSNDQLPHYSPDGAQILWRKRQPLLGSDGRPVTRPGPTPAAPRETVTNADIYKMNADGSGVVNLTPGTDDPGAEFLNRSSTVNRADDDFPAFSPDGTRFVFQSGRSGDVEVYTANASDGGDVRRLTTSPGFDGRCDWGPVARPATATPAQPAATPPRVRAARVRRACSSRSFRVRASASAGGRVQRVTAYLNGRRIVSTRRSSFRLRLPARLRRGRHRLTVVAVDAAGRRTRRVLRFRVCAAQRPRFTG